MQYLGGKAYIAKDLSCEINKHRIGPIWEPFCGGLNVTPHLGGEGIASDNNRALISLYTSVRLGWIPPKSLSKEEYQLAKALPDSDPLKAFAGAGVSFGGKWFGGYAKDRPQQRYAECSSNVLLRDIPKCAGFDFVAVDFLEVAPRDYGELTIYCDPPYAGTTGYGTIFDHALFWSRCVEWAKYAVVLVSEYSSPVGTCVWEKHRNLGMQSETKSAGRVERLFRI